MPASQWQPLELAHGGADDVSTLEQNEQAADAEKLPQTMQALCAVGKLAQVRLAKAKTKTKPAAQKKFACARRVHELVSVPEQLTPLPIGSINPRRPPLKFFAKIAAACVAILFLEEPSALLRFLAILCVEQVGALGSVLSQMLMRVYAETQRRLQAPVVMTKLLPHPTGLANLPPRLLRFFAAEELLRRLQFFLQVLLDFADQP